MTTQSPTPPQDPFASVVTAQTIYGSLQALRGELQADRTAQALLRQDVETLKVADRAKEDRLRSLEQWRWSLPAAAVSAALAAAAAIITALINIL